LETPEELSWNFLSKGFFFGFFGYLGMLWALGDSTGIAPSEEQTPHYLLLEIETHGQTRGKSALQSQDNTRLPIWCMWVVFPFEAQIYLLKHIRFNCKCNCNCNTILDLAFFAVGFMCCIYIEKRSFVIYLSKARTPGLSGIKKSYVEGAEGRGRG